MDLRKGTIFNDSLRNRENISLLNLSQNKAHKELVLDSLCNKVSKSSELRDVLDYVIEKKADMFAGDCFQGSLYDGEESTLDLILPSVRRAWMAFFINPPILFDGKRLEFFQLLFDIDEFLEYLANILPKVKRSLIHFDSLDRSVETITLATDNYVAAKVEMTTNTNNIESDIRDSKIEKALKNI